MIALSAAVCRRRGTRLHLEFVDGVDRREEDQNAGIGIHAVDAVDDISDILDGSAIDDGAVGAAAAGVTEQAGGASDALQDPGRQLHKLCEVARVQRQIDDLLGRYAPGRSQTMRSRWCRRKR